jgi:ribosome-associated protein
MINATQQIAPSADRDLDPERILADAAELSNDRKAQDIVALDLRGMVGYADYLLIATGRSDRQVKAIHDGIHLGLKTRDGLLPRRVEGLSEGRWVLMDYLDIVVHIFTPETREHYRLEQLWGDAGRVELDLEPHEPENPAESPDDRLGR